MRRSMHLAQKNGTRGEWSPQWCIMRMEVWRMEVWSSTRQKDIYRFLQKKKSTRACRCPSGGQKSGSTLDPPKGHLQVFTKNITNKYHGCV